MLFPMIVTVNSDASFSKTYKVGTFAYYIICDSFRFQSSGFIKTEVGNPNEAEAACIANALHFLKINAHKTGQITKIILNTDSKAAIKNINRKSARYGIFETCYLLLRELRIIHKISPHGNPFFELRYVKAHVKKAERKPRHHINEWCDKEARIQMGKRLAMIEMENKLLNQNTPQNGN